jgi:hypothetical protein
VGLGRGRTRRRTEQVRQTLVGQCRRRRFLRP